MLLRPTKCWDHKQGMLNTEIIQKPKTKRCSVGTRWKPELAPIQMRVAFRCSCCTQVSRKRGKERRCPHSRCSLQMKAFTPNTSFLFPLFSHTPFAFCILLSVPFLPEIVTIHLAFAQSPYLSLFLSCFVRFEIDRWSLSRERREPMNEKIFVFRAWVSLS